MKLIPTSLKDLVILEPTVFKDERGYFMESYHHQKMRDLLGDIHFVQDNESKSSKGVLRGLHFQKPPYSQAKLVRCIEGEILDVVVDLRRDSETFCKTESVVLSAENKKQLFIPRGFAHGFIVLSDVAIVSYKADNYYAPEHESGILWNDSELNIDWKMESSDVLISDKDQKLLPLASTENPF